MTLTLTLLAFELLVSLGGQAQQTERMHKVGYLTPWARSFEIEGIEVFEATLRERGYVQGQSISIVYRSAEGRDSLLPQLASELLRLNVNVLVTAGTPATRAAQQATSNVPIVMLTVLDPVRAGFVATLSHPGGNITGSSELGEELVAKRLEIIKEVIPRAALIAVLWDPTHPTNGLDLRRAETAAPTVGLKVRAVSAHTLPEIEKAFGEMARWHPDALLIMTSPATAAHMPQIAELARKARLPTMFGARPGALAGALLSYGPDLTDQYRNAALFVDKILKGSRAADLPVEQPTRFELLINSRTAKALGVTIPQSILVRADEVFDCYVSHPSTLGHCPKGKHAGSEP